MPSTRCNDIPSAECPHCGAKFHWDDYYDLAEGDERECPQCDKTIYVTDVDYIIHATLSTTASSTPASRNMQLGPIIPGTLNNAAVPEIPEKQGGCSRAATGYAAAPIPCEPAHKLAMLALQSERYAADPEFRDAVDEVLGWVNAAKRHNDQAHRQPPAATVERKGNHEIETED